MTLIGGERRQPRLAGRIFHRNDAPCLKVGCRRRRLCGGDEELKGPRGQPLVSIGANRAMRHHCIERVVPRNGGEAIGELLVAITGPQPVPRRGGLMLRHVRRKTVSHCVSLRCDKAKNSDDPLRLEPANVRGRMAEQFASTYSLSSA